jgi:hypothetical protein
MMRSEPFEVADPGAVVDRLGYVVCLDCWGDRILADHDATWALLQNLAGDPVPTCDSCRRHISECSPLRYTATAMVEYPLCKIF